MAWFIALLRGDDNRLEGITLTEAIGRYHQQGGRKDHTDQPKVIYNNTMEGEIAST